MRAFLKKHVPSFYLAASTVFKSISRFVYALITKHPKKWVVLKAVVTGLPATVLSFATLKLPSKAPGQESLLHWLGEHFHFVILIIIWPLIVQVIFALVEWLMDSTKNQIILERTRFAALYTALEEVVGKKGKRFGEYSHQLKTGKVSNSKAEAFDAVTDPARQIELLVEAAFSVLNTLLCKSGDVNDSVKVVLVDIENGSPVRFRAHLPNNTVPSSLMIAPASVRKTLWARAVQSGKTIVIEDIAHHLSPKGPRDKKYLPSGDAMSDRGSIVAIPIAHPQSGHIPFVLSIKSSESHKISEELLRELRPILTAFTNRLLLEYNIEFIKEHTNGRH